MHEAPHVLIIKCLHSINMASLRAPANITESQSHSTSLPETGLPHSFQKDFLFMNEPVVSGCFDFTQPFDPTLSGAFSQKRSDTENCKNVGWNAAAKSSVKPEPSPISLETAKDERQRPLLMLGLSVYFPFKKPYPAQRLIMSKLIKAIVERKHALMESPTGSGKTISLLCASLAWLEQEKIAFNSTSSVTATLRQRNHQAEQVQLRELLNDPDFISQFAPSQDFELPSTQPMLLNVDQFGYEDGALPFTVASSHSLPLRFNGADAEIQTYKSAEIKLKAPKIFYASRTHTQIAQAVHELRKSSYRPRMAVLGSRHQYCIHAETLKAENLSEACKNLAEHGNCDFFNNQKKLVQHPNLQLGGPNELWDIEDLVNLGKQTHGCPYYAACTLAENADIVFCPYNYLIDEGVRSAMGIDINNAVLILDEAHNVEDLGRSAASTEISFKQFSVCAADLAHLSKLDSEHSSYKKEAPLHQPVLEFIQRFQQFLNEQLERTTIMGQEHAVLWSGNAITTVFDQLGLTFHTWPVLLKQIEKILSKIGFAEDRTTCVNAMTETVLRKLIRVLSYMFMLNRVFLSDYRMLVLRDRDNSGVNNENCKLALWCLNSAVAFHSLKTAARSIILTSGTMSPMITFSSELDINFEIRLEADHVVDQRQIFSAVIAEGINRNTLNANFKSASSEAFQDELGLTLLNCVCSIPDGVLVFFPSYALLDKVTRRWHTTGMFRQINNIKQIVIEPRSTGDVFERAIQKYLNANARPRRRTTGGMFLAVCRGKLSEGIDFSDASARAAFIVGVPYPHALDLQVKLKKEHNDRMKIKNNNMLSGQEWYALQAYRAINQALGRVIRHRFDYGAIILLDERFEQDKIRNSLSRWVQQNLALQPRVMKVHEAAQQLKTFFEKWSCSQSEEKTMSIRPSHDNCNRDNKLAKLAGGKRTHRKMRTDFGCVPWQGIKNQTTEASFSASKDCSRTPLVRSIEIDIEDGLNDLHRSGNKHQVCVINSEDDVEPRRQPTFHESDLALINGSQVGLHKIRTFSDHLFDDLPPLETIPDEEK